MVAFAEEPPHQDWGRGCAEAIQCQLVRADWIARISSPVSHAVTGSIYTTAIGKHHKPGLLAMVGRPVYQHTTEGCPRSLTSSAGLSENIAWFT